MNCSKETLSPTPIWCLPTSKDHANSNDAWSNANSAEAVLKLQDTAVWCEILRTSNPSSGPALEKLRKWSQILAHSNVCSCRQEAFSCNSFCNAISHWLSNSLGCPPAKHPLCNRSNQLHPWNWHNWIGKVAAFTSFQRPCLWFLVVPAHCNLCVHHDHAQHRVVQIKGVVWRVFRSATLVA